MGELATRLDARAMRAWTSFACALVMAQAAMLGGCSEADSTAAPPSVVPLEGGSTTDHGADIVSGEPSADGSANDGADDGSDTSVHAEAGDALSEQACVHKSCAQLGAQCGSIPDDCGGSAECGSCPTGQICGGAGANRCGTSQCNPKTCAQLGASCGLVSDGCEASLSCGACQPPETCGGGGVSEQCGCTPISCASQGAQCGALLDGCGELLSCGDCAAGKTCGGGEPNKCGDAPCQPTTCTGLGAKCGSRPDGCKGALDCGTCASPQTCGGGGDSNSCGCTATTCAALGAECGSPSDGCGGNLACGSCPFGACNGSFKCAQPSPCTLPWGGSLAHGSSVTAYPSSSVACGSDCSGQTRVCTNGSLSGTYTQQSCSNTGACGGTHNTCQSNACVPDCSDRAADYYALRSDVYSYCTSDYCSAENVAQYWGGDTASCMQTCANWHWCTSGHNLGEWGSYGCRCYKNIADCTNKGFSWYPNPASTPSCD